MKRTPEQVIEAVLQHRDVNYDPQKRREYYLRTRKLKGRTRLPSGDNDPSKRGKYLQEDEVPSTSPSGAKIKDYSNGKAVYADGSVYTSRGWSLPKAPNVTGPKADKKSRLDSAQAKLNSLKKKLGEGTDEKSQALRKKLTQLQERLDRATRGETKVRTTEKVPGYTRIKNGKEVPVTVVRQKGRTPRVER